MKNFFLVSIFLSLLLVGCKENKKQADVRIDYNLRLTQFLERAFQKDLEDSPMLQTRLGIKDNYDSWDDFSHNRYAKEQEKAKERLSFLEDSIEQIELDFKGQLNFRLYHQKLQQEISDFDFRFYNYPVNQMFGVHSELPSFLINMHKIESEKDARDYIERLKKIPQVFSQVEEGMQLREFNGIIPPIFVYEHSLGVARNVISGRPFDKSTNPSILLSDFKAKIDKLDLDKAAKDQLVQLATKALAEQVEPAYQQLIAFLENQRQRATDQAGVWKFPKGDKFYEHALGRVTTTNYDAQSIHAIGKLEVERIHKEMETIKEEVGYKGNLQEFFEFMRSDEQFYFPNTHDGRQAYLQETTAIIDQMRSELGELFITRPQADIQVKAVESYREQSAGKAFYQPPALDASRPGIYYANLYDMQAMPKYQMEALAYHEGIPGHHMQIAIAQELDSLPMFRKLTLYTAFVEGWGLYAEYLPKEMGFYRDPYSDFGRLAMELWRSIRLVVDTGIHHYKWTREEGIDYYMENSPNAESDVIKMVERHIVMPAQATAYKIGMLKILELRSQAQEILGKEFDLRAFHEVILTSGALPLDVLEEKVHHWIEEKR